MPVEFKFDLPFEEAIQFFEKKGRKGTFSYTELQREDHDSTFVVAKMMDMELLKSVKEIMDDQISQGSTFHDFQTRIEPLLQEKGWWGEKEMVNPETGEKELVQLGSPRRLRTIFQTNLKTAYSAGLYQKIQDTKESAPYLLYDAVDDERTRDEHRAWDGLVLKVDDPWWKTHFPPNGWGCRCSVIQLNDWQLKEMLGKSGPDKAPGDIPQPWINPNTGKTEMIPQGIDPGWDYTPGASKIDKLFNEKVREASREFDIPAKEIKDSVPQEEEKREKENAEKLQVLLERASQAFPATEFKFGKADSKAMDEAISALEVSNKDVPELVAHVKGVKVESWDSPAIAGNEDGNILLNPDWFGNYEKLKKDLRKNVEEKFYPEKCDTIKSIIDHEIAHEWRKVVNIEGDKVLLEIFRNLTREEIKNGLSEYAAERGYEEFIEEAWREFRNNPAPRPIAKTIGERLLFLRRNKI